MRLYSLTPQTSRLPVKILSFRIAYFSLSYLIISCLDYSGRKTEPKFTIELKASGVKFIQRDSLVAIFLILIFGKLLTSIYSKLFAFSTLF